MTDPSSRSRGGSEGDAPGDRGPMLIGIAMVSVGIVALLVLYWPSGSDERSRHSDEPTTAKTAERSVRGNEQPGSKTAKTAARAAPLPPPPAIEPDAALESFARPRFWEEPGPELLDETYDFLTNDTRKLRSTKTKALYDYGQENPTDARPQLLLAFDDMKRGWWSTAVTHYKLAYDADPRAKQEPRLVRHLAFVAGDPKQSADAIDLLRRIYGTDAETLIAKEMEQLRGKDDKLSRWWLSGIERGLGTMQANP